MFLSSCYTVVRWALQFTVLCFRSGDFKELEIVVLRHELAILRRHAPPSEDDVDRPHVSRGGQPTPAAATVAVLSHHTGHAPGLASAFGGETLDHTQRDPVDRRSAVKCKHWCCVLRETIRGGAICASSAK